jgi:hypothetical protein
VQSQEESTPSPAPETSAPTAREPEDARTEKRGKENNREQGHLRLKEKEFERDARTVLNEQNHKQHGKCHPKTGPNILFRDLDRKQ